MESSSTNFSDTGNHAPRSLPAASDQLVDSYIEPSPNPGHRPKSRCLYQGCNREFANKKNARNHVQKEHCGKKHLYYCGTCNKGFSSIAAAKRHQKSKAEGNKYPCAKCGNSYPRKDQRDKHAILCQGAGPS